MPLRRITPTAFFFIFGFNYILKAFLLFSFFFLFLTYRGVFWILLHAITHNLTNVKCAAAWLVQPFKDEPGRYRPSFQQEHDMQLKHLISREILQTANCTAQKCFFMFFSPSHWPCRLLICRQCEKWAPATFQCQPVLICFPAVTTICIFETDEQTSLYLSNYPTYGQPIRFPLLLYPNALVNNIISTLSQRTCVHRGVFSFSFSFLYKSEKYYFQHLH